MQNQDTIRMYVISAHRGPARITVSADLPLGATPENCLLYQQVPVEKLLTQAPDNAAVMLIAFGDDEAPQHTLLLSVYLDVGKVLQAAIAHNGLPLSHVLVMSDQLEKDRFRELVEHLDGYVFAAARKLEHLPPASFRDALMQVTDFPALVVTNLAKPIPPELTSITAQAVTQLGRLFVLLSQEHARRARAATTSQAGTSPTSTSPTSTSPATTPRSVLPNFSAN